MPKGLPGADSSQPVTAALIQSATDLYGAAPVFWGRYFTSVTTAGSVEYRHAKENGPLNAAGIRLLPVARQTKHVNGTQQQGVTDGVANAKDYITTFGAAFLAARGGKFYMFLDVEGDPSLSPAYYTGWAEGLAQESANQCESAGLAVDAMQVQPCVYGPQSDSATWSALGTAQADGAQCMGVWIARYNPNECNLADWSDLKVTPSTPSPFPWPILAWQFSDKCLSGQIDGSQTNPNTDAQSQLLDFLVLPPPAPPAT